MLTRDGVDLLQDVEVGGGVVVGKLIMQGGKCVRKFVLVLRIMVLVVSAGNLLAWLPRQGRASPFQHRRC